MPESLIEGTLLDGLDDDEQSHSDGSPVADVLHQHLYGDGITMRHRPQTGRTFVARPGISNHVITSYVEHAFLAWLLDAAHGVQPPTVQSGGNCHSGDVDPEIFFEQVNIKDFLDTDSEEISVKDILEPGFSEGADTQWREMAQEYAAAREGDQVRLAQAKRVCGGCPFSLDCLTSAVLTGSEYGVWGGLDSEERHLIHNRFNTMRREYENGSMPPAMRKDFESQAAQIAARVAQQARVERAKAQRVKVLAER